MTKKIIELVIYFTAAMLVVGVFLPLAKLPFYGEISYHRIAPTETYLAILFAMLASVLTFYSKTKFTLLPAVGVWLTLLFPAIKDLFKPDNNLVFVALGKKTSSALQDFSADLFLNITDFSWGGYIFIIGVLGFSVGCILLFKHKS